MQRFSFGLERLRRRSSRRRVGEGILLGAWIGVSGSLLGINDLSHSDFFTDILILPMVVCAILAQTRYRKLPRIAAALMLFALLLVGYTPLVNPLIHSLVRRDTLRMVPAVVVLSTYLHKDRSLNAAGQERLFHAWLLLRQGLSSRLVITDAITDYGREGPEAIRLLRGYGFSQPIEVTGPVRDTHDEAVETARLVHLHGWKEVILVTHPWHMRRAKSVFEKAGVHVLCAPCQEGSYDLDALNTPMARLHAFRDWLHETLGWATYRLRGWI